MEEKEDTEGGRTAEFPGREVHVNKAEKDVFLELFCFFDDPEDHYPEGNLISGSSAFSKTSLNIWKFSIHVLLKPGLENLALLY